MKFDLIISNPPYNHNLDLKILKEVYELSEKICFVHPTTWLYDKKMKSKLYNDCRNLVKHSFVHYEKVENANKVFGIGLFTDVFVTLFDKHKPGIGDMIYDIDIHGDSDIYKSLKQKILLYCNKNNLLQNIEYKKNKKQKQIHKNYQVGLPGMAPGGRNVMIQKTNEYAQCAKNTKYASKFFFDTEVEAINFKDYLKTKIARFCLSIYKTNQHLHYGELASVPYIPTYTRPWTDEEVAKELGLTDEELAWAINWIPDYYPEDKEKYGIYKIK
jgi:hypothetical protein